ncbi:MAG: hypothetical protein ACREH4_02965 [Vitreimonas sp.]
MKDRAAPRTPPTCDLRIDELVLEGFPPNARYAIAAALEQELTRLLTGPDAAIAATAGSNGRGSMSADRLDGGVITLAPNASPQSIGIEAARAVSRNLGLLITGGGAPSPGGRRS